MDADAALVHSLRVISTCLTEWRTDRQQTVAQRALCPPPHWLHGVGALREAPWMHVRCCGSDFWF